MRVAGRLRRVKGAVLWFEGAVGGPLGQVSLLLAAALLDFVVGDPWGWPHPVQAMGWVIGRYSEVTIRWSPKPPVMKLAGIGLAVLLMGGTFGVSAVGLSLLAKISPLLRWSGECVLLASCFAGRSLRRAAVDVLQPLSGDVEEIEISEAALMSSREKLALYVGRDTAQLSESEVYRAVLETVSENAIDGVLAPLFYAIVGACMGWAAPMALAYKAASTLDSMVGYREAPYTDLGWFSAQFEDALTWVPCRLSVIMVAVLSGRPKTVLRLCWRDARADPSPNAGWSECAYAAALGVQLGGANMYRGQLKIKPMLGESTRPITASVINQAMQLTRWSFLVGLGIGIAMLLQLSIPYLSYF